MYVRKRQGRGSVGLWLTCVPEMELKAVTWTEKAVSAAEIMSCFTLLGSNSALLLLPLLAVALITVPANVMSSGREEEEMEE